MTKPVFKLAAVVVLWFLAFPVGAQQITPGMIVLVKSSSGKYLSAISNERLGLTTNRVEWEQWEVVKKPDGSRYLRSYHGTALILENNGKAYHAPLGQTDFLRLGSVKETKDSQGRTQTWWNEEIVNGGPMYIAAPSSFYLDEAYGGAYASGVRWVGNSVEQVPPYARWTVEIVSNPLGGRRPAQTALFPRTAYRLRSYHNTFLDAKDPSSSQAPPTLVVAGAGGKSFEFIYTDRDASYPLKFGDQIMLTRVAFYPWSLMPGATDTVVWGSDPQQPPYYWRVLPTPAGSFRIGERVPLGEKVLIQGSWQAGNIGVTPEARVYRHANSAQWEWLAFSK